MESGWYSVEQVAERLGLHVRTVRGYIRDGRLPATRIGKQYRIARADLDAFTGQPPARPRAEASTLVEIDDADRVLADRISTMLVAGAQMVPGMRVQAIYDEARGRLRVLLFGGAGATAEALTTIDAILGSERDHD